MSDLSRNRHRSALRRPAILVAALALAGLLLGPAAAVAHHHPEPDPLAGNDSCPVCLWQQHTQATLADTPSVDRLIVDRQGPPPPASATTALPVPQTAARAPPASAR